MRGDSRRDFYAKALAVFGLSLLGAIAAVVDNWPAHPVASTAAAAVTVPGAPAAPLRLDLAKLEVTTDGPAARAAVAPTPVRSEPTRPAVVPIDTARDTTARAPEVPAAVPASIAVESGMPMNVRFARATFVDGPEPPPAVFVGPVEDHNYLMASPSTRSAAVAAPVNDGFFSGAVKKTQDTLARTGSTIADAFRAVGGAVKRVMPF